jgi:cyclophilin family peptidyl-prolyl cis-trans isomerase/predicted GIY-YIG superfamily endonuclease
MPKDSLVRRDQTGFFVYVLACADGSLYAGWCRNLAVRMLAHASGRGAKYVRSRLPFALAAFWPVADGSAARRQEAAFKQLSRSAKLAVLAGGGFAPKMRNAPLLLHLSERLRMEHAPPTGDELQTLAEEARSSHARIATAKGEIVFRFFPDDAPGHCAAFVKLARSGFYDGLTFHRVEPGFVIQGGDPAGDGTGGPGYRLKAEFNERPHMRGTVAMARASDPNSAGSQFYICLGDAGFLDRQYTVFGQLESGLETLDRIRKGDVMESVKIEAS